VTTLLQMTSTVFQYGRVNRHTRDSFTGEIVPKASSTGTKKVYPPLVDTFSTSPRPPGKRVWNWVKPLEDLEDVGSLSASVNFGGNAITSH
jgi:hypothetical protein